ncbi:hypothetical protein TorRG33x02_322930 [Trema orientale]|uniref:Uncharacterized protein n=1 Tax=Trema orientale TaxID=63057 RepID=A0A2P5BFS3_TREOI|nr:hypothetical protein TorRG33x02_322930 [Trema orientale]
MSHGLADVTHDSQQDERGWNWQSRAAAAASQHPQGTPQANNNDDVDDDDGDDDDFEATEDYSDEELLKRKEP